MPNVFLCFHVADNGVLSSPEHLLSPVLAVPPQIWAAAAKPGCMLASAARVVVARPQLLASRLVRQVPTQHIKHMRTSVAAAGGSSGEEQATGTLEHMSVNDLQELLLNPVMVGNNSMYDSTRLSSQERQTAQHRLSQWIQLTYYHLPLSIAIYDAPQLHASRPTIVQSTSAYMLHCCQASKVSTNKPF
jgi:hypothetical protein